jgi:hypothetical protein
MRWFLDTEFAENGEMIKLISLALVSEYGEEYYVCLVDGWSLDDCNDWVKANVLPKLPPLDDAFQWSSRSSARSYVEQLLLRDGAPEIWADYGSYDWVAFCQLFGTMMDLPSGMPMFVRDLRQEIARLGVDRSELPRHPGMAHVALDDARELRERWLWLQQRNVK